MDQKNRESIRANSPRKHEEKYCPRCNTRFECKISSILLCQCSALPLTQDETLYMRKEFDECLCVTCISALRVEFHNKQFDLTLKNMMGKS